MYLHKWHIAKLILCLGFFLSMGACTMQLIALCNHTNDAVSIILEETEESKESSEKEQSEIEDDIEQEKIVYEYSLGAVIPCTRILQNTVEIYIKDVSVYLEHQTPPPRC